MHNAEDGVSTHGNTTEKDSASIHGEASEPEKVAQPETHQPSSDPLGNDTEVASAGRVDGGTTAWLVVLGAWCCSFTSPGWINSTIDSLVRVCACSNAIH